MTPEKAIKLGVPVEQVRCWSWAERYRGDWVVYVPDDERGERVLFSSPSLYRAARWLNDLRRLHASMGSN